MFFLVYLLILDLFFINLLYSHDMDCKFGWLTRFVLTLLTRFDVLTWLTQFFSLSLFFPILSFDIELIDN
jgi:hypothetical protein